MGSWSVLGLGAAAGAPSPLTGGSVKPGGSDTSPGPEPGAGAVGGGGELAASTLPMAGAAGGKGMSGGGGYRPLGHPHLLAARAPAPPPRDHVTPESSPPPHQDPDT